MVDRVLGIAFDQRGSDFCRLVEPLRPHFANHERRSGNWRARLGAEHLFEGADTLLAVPGIDLRYADLCLQGRVIGI